MERSGKMTVQLVHSSHREQALEQRIERKFYLPPDKVDLARALLVHGRQRKGIKRFQSHVL